MYIVSLLLFWVVQMKMLIIIMSLQMLMMEVVGVAGCTDAGADTDSAAAADDGSCGFVVQILMQHYDK